MYFFGVFGILQRQFHSQRLEKFTFERVACGESTHGSGFLENSRCDVEISINLKPSKNSHSCLKKKVHDVFQVDGNRVFNIGVFFHKIICA